MFDIERFVRREKVVETDCSGSDSLLYLEVHIAEAHSKRPSIGVVPKRSHMVAALTGFE